MIAQNPHVADNPDPNIVDFILVGLIILAVVVFFVHVAQL